MAGRHFVNMLESEEEGAILLAGLSEIEALDRKPTQLEWPETLNQDYHLALVCAPDLTIRQMTAIGSQLPQILFSSHRHRFRGESELLRQSRVRC